MITTFITRPTVWPFGSEQPWEAVARLEERIAAMIAKLEGDYEIRDGVAVHRTAVIGSNVLLKGPVIVSEGCFVGANSCLRNGVFMAPGARVGIACEIKTSLLLEGCAVAHFNFVGDSIVGHDVNIEAGAIVANHFNERTDKEIHIRHNGRRIATGMAKFGSLIGDDSRIGANAVLSPGTLLAPHSIVRRLELVEQDPLPSGGPENGLATDTGSPAASGSAAANGIASGSTVAAGEGLQLEGVHHIAIICSDYRRSLDFYTQLLGLRLLSEHYRAERDSYKADLALGDRYTIELFSFPSPPSRVTRPEAAGLRHLAFEVADLDAAAAMLDRRGVVREPIRIDEYTGRRFLFFADPDGLPLELYER